MGRAPCKPGDAKNGGLRCAILRQTAPSARPTTAPGAEWGDKTAATG